MYCGDNSYTSSGPVERLVYGLVFAYGSFLKYVSGFAYASFPAYELLILVADVSDLVDSSASFLCCLGRNQKK